MTLQVAISGGQSRATSLQKMNRLVEYGLGIGQTTGIVDYGDLRDKLNTLAVALGLPTFADREAGSTVRAKLNAMNTALGLDRDLDLFYKPGTSQFWGDTGPVASSSKVTDAHNDGNAMVMNAAGVWSAVAANALSVSDLGHWVYPTRTNLFPNSSNAGAVAGSPGTPGSLWSNFNNSGIAQTALATGTINGLPYIDVTIGGTASSNPYAAALHTFASIMTVAATTTYTVSLYMALLAGALPTATIALRVAWFDASNASLGQTDTPITPDGTLQRFSGSVTSPVNAAKAQIQFRITTTISSSYSWVMRLAGVQLEQGTYASPPILTTTAAKTRLGNVVNLALPVAYQAGAGLFAKLNIMGIDPAALPSILSLNPPTKLTRSLLDVALDGGTIATGQRTIVAAGSPGYGKVRNYGSADTTAVASDYEDDIVALALGGNGFDVNDNIYGVFQEIGLKSGAMNDTVFNAIYGMAA